MRVGWKNKRLGDLLEVQNGYAFDSKEFNSSKGMPLIRIRSLKAGVETETRFGGSYDGKYVVNAGDLLIGMDGEFGCYVWKGEPALLNQRVCRLQGFDSQLVPQFLFYGINSYLKAIEEVTGFTTVKHISSKQILGIDFPVPPLSEQQRIVTLLDEAFDGIATARANAEQNLQNARALFESYLQSVFMNRGDEWKEVALENCCEQIFAGGDVPKDCVSQIRTEKLNVPIFSNGEKNDGLYGFTAVARVKKPSITISARGTIGFSVIRTEPYLPVVRLIVLIPDEKVLNLSFLYYRVIGMNFENTGTSIPQLTVPNIKSRTLYLPSLAQQDVIVSKLDKLKQETQRLESIYQRKLAALDALKKSLLHQAFSGAL